MKKCICFIFTIILSMTFIFQTASADGTNVSSKKNKYNVVYVIDNSGSMKDTDPNNYRYDAVYIFTALLTDNGNYVGDVVFSDEIKHYHTIEEITSNDQKNIIVDSISNTEIKGWTDSGEALDKAVDMLLLDELENNGNESVILYLTDGNTEMGTQNETDTSKSMVQTAVQKAMENDIRIFSLCLNMDNSVDPSEMKNIADQTDGMFMEVVRSYDMIEVFKMFYEEIYSTKATEIQSETEIDATGNIEVVFDVPYAGVEELNIIIKSEAIVSDIEITPEEKNGYISMSPSGNYAVVKISEPTGGKHKISLDGSQNTLISISTLYNTSLSVNAEIVNGQEDYGQGDVVTIAADIITGKNKYADGSILDGGYSVKAVITDKYNKANEYNAVYDKNKGRFLINYTIPEDGTYTAFVKAEGNGITAKSDSIAFNVNNTPPELLTEFLSETAYYIPLLDVEFTAEFDLNDAVRDKEDETLTFEILQKSFSDDAFTHNGNSLIVDDFFADSFTGITNGWFKIKATDTDGAFVEFMVYAKSKNVPFIILIAAIILAILILAGIGIKVYRETARFYRGIIEIEVNYEDGSTAYTELTPKRGRCKLSRIGSSGVPLKSIQGMNFSEMYFISLGKKGVKLRSRRKFIIAGNIKPVKSKDIGQYPITIYPVKNAALGGEESITITFQHDQFTNTM